MAILKDKLTGLPKRDSAGNQIKITTAGETRCREMRAAKEAARQEMHLQNRISRDSRSPEQQLALLDRRLGVGIGATKERQKLYRLISEREANMRSTKELEAKREENRKKSRR